VASRSQVARETMRPRMATYMGWVRDLITISTPALADLVPPFDLDRLIERGPTVCGSPAEVVDKVGLWAEMTGMDLYLAMFDMGGMPPAELRGMMELFSAEVAPHLG
ncbi:MAG: methylene-tetrahydromethanopterin reductase, partial [Acidimicrobiia bacterium]|nr:methylene-tetrahydromethanopterin reductase [Acidimicrobiia bacterium]